MFVKPFSQISKNDAAIAGGKGASLGEMTQAGIPVPPGFIILANAFERFLEETDLNVEIDTILHSVDHREMHTVENASEKIQALILGAKMPKDIVTEVKEFYKKLDAQYVAVRSSATAEDSASAAWAGQLDSFLNTTEEKLLTNVQKCWASLFTPRAIFYRFEKELHTQKISVAVVVQKMVESECSGIAFSVHPVTEDRNQLIIEAGFGLGEAIVSGSVTPDSYVVEKEPRRIIDTNINKQTRALYRVDSGGNEWKDIPEPKASSQVLSEKQILELSELILRIENHYGFPCDIEWAFEDGMFYITQSRPITTLTQKNKDVFTTMVNMQSREHSLTYCHVWQIANQTQTRDWFESVRNILFVNNGMHKKTRVWYGQKEFDDIFINTGTRVKNEEDFFHRVSKEFVLLTDELVPYCEGEKKIESLKEWEWFYKKWIEWWAPMAIIFVLPESKTAPKSIREKALALRAKTEKYSDSGDRLVMEYLHKQYPRHKELVEFMTPDEILHIEELTDAQINKIKGRQNGYVFFNGTLYARNELDSITAKYNLRLDEPHIQSSSEIKGSCASRGKVTGSVVVIYGKNDLARVTLNSVLVTEMTSPDYVPYLKKVAAIVTDEGGVNCHAAIVSREMNIPCVIGTKIATQVLKDGDFVEVDADAGVIRIINPENPFGSIDQWQRLFRVQGLRFLIDDIWMEHYKTLGALTVIIDDEYTSYLPHKVMERTLADGADLISNADQFEQYGIEFRAYMKDVQSYAASLAVDNASKEEIEHLLNEFARLFYYYSKTEFFSTDGAYKLFEKTKDKGLEKRLEQMGQIKNDGRSFLNSIFFGADGVLPKLLKSLEKRFSVPERVLQQYSREEMLGLFDNKRVPDEEIERRNNAFYILGKDGATIIKTGTEARKDIQAFVGESAREHSETITGTSAHLGKARGTARIIRAGYDNFDTLHHLMDAMQKGDILIAETTSPELMPACKKAGGIITDQGGMLSHAAIVSRELNIPCVVGTSNATEVIKDGDLIEIDGDKGVIHIIERTHQ